MFLRLLLLSVAWLSLAVSPARSQTSLWEAPLPPLPEGRSPATVEADHYGPAVEALMRRFEEQIGRRLTPGEKGKVGLKIYAESGAGLATPRALVRAVIDALVRRGYAAEDVFLVGLNQLRLRLTGYLPTDPRLTPPFAGHPLYVLESGRFYDPIWFYDSPLPSRFDPILSGRQDQAPHFDLDRLARGDGAVAEDLAADRKSFLATPLFLEADFWINLPVYTDHEALGVNGALVNATLWNASNTTRFFRSTRSAPAAVAEMAAIPELRESWAFSLVSLEQWQFVGGPAFNARYTKGEPVLWLGTDPVWMDSLMLRRMNAARVEAGFTPISDEIRTLEFAETLDLGTRRGEAPVRVAPAE